MNKYNIALTPLNKNQEFIQLAEHFIDMADVYLLGEQSFPHVTLYQFRADKNEVLPLWNKAALSVKINKWLLEFNTFSYSSYDEDFYWISLLPDQRSLLFQLHHTISKIIKQPPKPLFDPHLTLLRTKDKNNQRLVAQTMKSFLPIKDHFTLSLGLSDEIGQFIKVIKSLM